MTMAPPWSWFTWNLSVCDLTILPACFAGHKPGLSGLPGLCLTSLSGEPDHLFKHMSGFFREASFTVIPFFYGQAAFISPFSLSLANLLEFESYWAVLPAPSLKVS